jgi:hypothetical protein
LIFIPALRQPSSLDFFVLFAGISLLGNRDESRIDDLTATGLEALGAEDGRCGPESCDACSAHRYNLEHSQALFKVQPASLHKSSLILRW